MSLAAKKNDPGDREPVRILGRGLRAARGVHLPLRVLREAVGRTQAEVGRAASMDQGDVSRLEGRVTLDDSQIATLRRYVAALGGELEVVARFGDRRISIVGAAGPHESAPVRAEGDDREG